MLGSGSSGNATIVESTHGSTTTRLLVDCGFGIKHLEARLLRAGLRGDDVDAVFITHEHGDHIGCATQFSARYGTAVWMSDGTHAGVGRLDFGDRLRIARDSQSFEINDLQVTPFTVPHDAREPLQLRCTDGHATLGILTDLGHGSTHVLRNLEPCSHVLLECNHCPDMLATSAYPEFLKRRVGGKLGHLANAEAQRIAALLKTNGQLRHITAAHLSERNNTPALARLHMTQALSCADGDICVADPVLGTDWISL
jgi:phosphoribosyl 1,2-cyclic phosphodiesterase